MLLEELPLLPIDYGDLRYEIWQLDFDDSGPPILRISCNLVPDWQALPRTRVFKALVLPEVLRSILKQIVLIERYTDLEDEDNWRTQWLIFATKLSGMSEQLRCLDDARMKLWIDNVVGAFCRRIHLSDLLKDDAYKIFE